MTHMNTLMPHPVLKPNGFDYSNACSFGIEITQNEVSDGRIKIGISYNLASNTISGLIRSGEAKFYSVIKCTRTYTRYAHSGMNYHVDLDLDPSEYAGTLSISPYVIASTEIVNFRSEEHDAEFGTGDEGLKMPAGCILAIGDTHEVDLWPKVKMGSAIKLIQKPNIERGLYAIRTDLDYIHIELHQDTMRHIDAMRGSAQALLSPSLYLAAIERAMHDLEDNKGRLWAQALSDTLEKNNIVIDGDTPASDIHRYAQMLLHGPLGRMIEWHTRQTGDDE